MEMIQHQTDSQDLERAKAILASQNYTCVLCKGDSVYTTTLRGVRPLARWLDSSIDFTSFSAADKVVGKATAYLYQLLMVREVYAQIMSQSALEVLTSAGIRTEYDRLVPNIINRTGDGICPFEAAVLDVHTPEDARTAIWEKMQNMGITL